MANVYPKDIRFLLADAVRQEQGGKLTVLGLYSGDVIVLIQPMPEIPAGVTGFALPGLAIVATVLDGQGQFDCNLSLWGPSGKKLGGGVGNIRLEKKKDSPANLIFQFEQFPVPRLGIYRAILSINGHDYEYKFKLKHLNPDFRFPSPVKPNKKNSEAMGKEKLVEKAVQTQKTARRAKTVSA